VTGVEMSARGAFQEDFMMQRLVRGTALAVLGLLALAVPAGAAGFGLFEQGAKGMGLAGAFTAQADDPSAMFHNAGGIAFTEKRAFYVGTTYVTFTKADFKGGTPFPGTGVTAEQKTLSQFLPNAYWAQPITDTWKFGLGIEAPFGLTTEWKNPASFAGRYLSSKAALRAIDLNPTLAWKLTPNFGLGLGLIARFSDVELRRYVPFLNPFTQRLVDVASVKLDSGFEQGYGWNIGLLDRYNESFSWGLSYRSKVKVDYDGTAHFTQISTGNPVIDAIIAQRLPFGSGVDAKTSIEFPDMASLGVNLAFSPTVRLELDANWTGWSTFDKLPITFTQYPPLSSLVVEDWQDVWNYRAGLSWKTTTCEWRFGYVYDQTPQPDKSVSPLLPDANRNGLTLGWGHQFGGANLDLALMYLKFDERTTTTNQDNFNGTYNTTAWLFGASIGF
jgi:long-chain fatty acid transport protein